MSLVPLGYVRLPDDEIMVHVIDTETDDTLVMDCDWEETIARVDSSARVYVREERIGYFYMTADETWFYIDDRTKDIMVTNFKDLIKAEQYVFGQIL